MCGADPFSMKNGGCFYSWVRNNAPPRGEILTVLAELCPVRRNIAVYNQLAWCYHAASARGSLNPKAVELGTDDGIDNESAIIIDAAVVREHAALVGCNRYRREP